jgi:hypothetical protein
MISLPGHPQAVDMVFHPCKQQAYQDYGGVRKI